MSIVIELERGARKAGHVCSRDYRRGPNCPLIVRQTSEDVFTANVFGILRRLRPCLWLRPLLNEAFRTKRFGNASMKGLDVRFWHPLPPPSVRAAIEGESEVDVFIRFGETAVLVEAKYNADLSPRTKHDATRNQLARLLDVAYTSMVAEQFFPREPYVLLIGCPRQEPPLVSAYRHPAQLQVALEHHKRFPDHQRMVDLLARRLGYLSWSDVARILTAAIRHATETEQAFLVDVIRYVRHKVATAGRRGGAQAMLPTIPSVESRDEA